MFFFFLSSSIVAKFSCSSSSLVIDMWELCVFDWVTQHTQKLHLLSVCVHTKLHLLCACVMCSYSRVQIWYHTIYHSTMFSSSSWHINPCEKISSHFFFLSVSTNKIMTHQLKMHKSYKISGAGKTKKWKKKRNSQYSGVSWRSRWVCQSDQVPGMSQQQ